MKKKSKQQKLLSHQSWTILPRQIRSNWTFHLQSHTISLSVLPTHSTICIKILLKSNYYSTAR